MSKGNLVTMDPNSPAKREAQEAASCSPDPKEKPGTKTSLRVALALVMLTGMAAARDLADAPSAVVVPASGSFAVQSTVPTPVAKVAENKTVDTKFVTLALISTASTFADSYTTLWATQNWQAGKQNVCNMEVQSPYLYGTHPTAGRAYAVATGKSAAALLASYYLRKHHSRLWSLPMAVNAAFSVQGVAQNMVTCN